MSRHLYVLPPGRIVKRAREWHLYDQKGDRYVDFFQAEGTAFLGHRLHGVSRAAKAEVDKGLWAYHAGYWKDRLQKALSMLSQAVFGNKKEYFVLRQSIHERIPRWFPLSGNMLQDTEKRFRLVTAADTVMEPVLPFPFADAWGMGHSPIVTAALTKAAWILLQYLSSREAKDRIDCACSLPMPYGYKRYGVYLLYTKKKQRDYEQLRRLALEFYIILPPIQDMPLIVPGFMSSGERKNWRRLCDAWCR